MSVRLLTKIETSLKDTNVGVAAGWVCYTSVTSGDSSGVRLPGSGATEKVMKFIKWELNFCRPHISSAGSAATQLLDRSPSFLIKTENDDLKNPTDGAHSGESVSLRARRRWPSPLRGISGLLPSFRYLTRAASLRGRVKRLAVNWLPYPTDPVLRWGLLHGSQPLVPPTRPAPILGPHGKIGGVLRFFLRSTQNKWCRFADSCDNHYNVGKYPLHSSIFRLLEEVSVESTVAQTCGCSSFITNGFRLLLLDVIEH